jgi:hypothetical protein
MLSPPISPAPNITYLRNFAIGFACFVALCGQKSIELMSYAQPQPPKRTRVTWTSPEIYTLLDFLIQNRSKMGDSGSFPQSEMTNYSLRVLMFK